MINKPVYFADRTAICRKSPSKPLKILARKGLIQGCVLYYGRGKDFPGVDLIREVVGNNYVDFDPADQNVVEIPTHYHWHSRFDTVLSIYVLNVLDPGKRCEAISDVWNFLKTGGTAYFAVRGKGDSAFKSANKKWTPKWDGFITGIHTFQKFYSVEEFTAELKPFFKTVELIHGTASSSELLIRAIK
jgi:hypothetical protein